MCTMITQSVVIDGSGKGRDGWFEVDRAHVSYDHPFNASFEHALNIDFVNVAQGLEHVWRSNSVPKPPARW